MVFTRVISTETHSSFYEYSLRAVRFFKNIKIGFYSDGVSFGKRTVSNGWVELM